MTHITWSIEKDGRCPKCNSRTVLVVAPEWWQVDPDSENAELADDEYNVVEEITGHYCPSCGDLVSLSFNV